MTLDRTTKPYLENALTALYKNKGDEKELFSITERFNEDPTSFSSCSIDKNLLPIFPSLNGFTNLRDLGSYKSLIPHKRIRKGMIYRSAAFDELKGEDIKKAKDVLKIRTELDLREESFWKSESVLGLDVSLLHPSNPKGGVYYLEGNGNPSDGLGLYSGGKTLYEELSVFMDPKNYPIDIHCMIGRDRTGTLAFLLLGLLGVDILDIRFDYLTSFLYECAKPTDEHLRMVLFNGFQSMVRLIKDETNEENFYLAIKKYVTMSFEPNKKAMKIGLNEKDIKTFQDIMLEKC